MDARDQRPHRAGTETRIARNFQMSADPRMSVGVPKAITIVTFTPRGGKQNLVFNVAFSRDSHGPTSRMRDFLKSEAPHNPADSTLRAVALTIILLCS